VKTQEPHPFRSERARAEYRALYAERARAWPVPSETRLVETSSGETFVRLSGSPAHPPLVLLPGSRGTSLSWIPNIAALSARYRTHALDSLYDFGLSVRRRPLKKPADLVTWLDEVLSALVPEGPLSLVGLSYGGWLAGQYALRFPGRLHKIVLISPALTVLPVSFALIFRAMLTLIPLPGFRRQFYYWLLNDSLQSGDSGRAAVDEAVADWVVAERCFRPLPLVRATVLDDKTLQGFGVPCLYMVGENEKIYPAHKAVERLNRVVPQIQTRLVPGAGHDLWMLKADLVTTGILSFLAGPEPGAPGGPHATA
jgi:pimeloyl-ACP methyl ester carboxylesterase